MSYFTVRSGPTARVCAMRHGGSTAPKLQRHFGEVRPAAMMIIAGLLDARMKIEMEVTARKRG